MNINKLRHSLSFFVVVSFAALGSTHTVAQDFSDELYFGSTTGDKLSLYGNRLGDTNMYGLGIETYTLYYKSSGNHRWYTGTNANGGASADMTLSSTGLLGLGTSSPNHELVIQANDPVMQIRDDVSDNSANAARIELLERAGGNYNGGAYLWWNGQSNRFFLGTKSGGTNTNVLVIDRGSNNVGIGTQNLDNGNYKLVVNGAIRAKEIIVDTGWADFVFEEDYELAPLQEVAQHIKDHGHLPDIPSAEEVEQNGISLGDMQSKLLMKIEELTLHIIDLEARLAGMEGENNTQVAMGGH